MLRFCKIKAHVGSYCQLDIGLYALRLSWFDGVPKAPQLPVVFLDNEAVAITGQTSGDVKISRALAHVYAQYQQAT